MQGINFPPDKLFYLLTRVVPKTEDIPDERALEMIIDLEDVLDHIKKQDPFEVFMFLLYVVDNHSLFPHLIKALRTKFYDELTVVKQVNLELRSVDHETMARVCVDRSIKAKNS